MFEILKALMALRQAATDHSTHAEWRIDHTGIEPMLVITIPIDDEDLDFIAQMRELVG